MARARLADGARGFAFACAVFFVAFGLVTLAWMRGDPVDGSPSDAGLKGPASLALFGLAVIGPAVLSHAGRERPHAGAWSMGAMGGSLAGALAGSTVWYGLWRDSGRYGPFDVGFIMAMALVVTVVAGLPFAVAAVLFRILRARRGLAAPQPPAPAPPPERALRSRPPGH